jgi:hypothetical protein
MIMIIIIVTTTTITTTTTTTTTPSITNYSYIKSAQNYWIKGAGQGT